MRLCFIEIEEKILRKLKNSFLERDFCDFMVRKHETSVDKIIPFLLEKYFCPKKLYF